MHQAIFTENNVFLLDIVLYVFLYKNEMVTKVNDYSETFPVMLIFIYVQQVTESEHKFPITDSRKT